MAVFSSNVKYEVINLIAEGGMGTVYKAKKKGVDGFEKIVAIKTMLDSYTSDKVLVKRFIEEAKMVADLVHENIVQIYQLDKYKGNYFFVLEFVDGISLFDFIEFHIQTRKILPENLAVFITSRIARGLAYAHTRRDTSGQVMNIVHCDVCPHNILITSEGLPKLTDFGIAKAKSMTDYSSISGKLPFMSPEQATGSDIDFRSDIYSLGAVLFYMLTGDSIRDMNEDIKVILKQAKNNLIQWHKLSPETPSELQEILAKMLATNPAERYQATTELARDLEYHIYKSGYGPTVVTLAEYMHKFMPGKFMTATDMPKTDELEHTIPMNTDNLQPDNSPIMEEDKTVVLPASYFEEKAARTSKLPRTVVIPDKHFKT
ncbi:MAG: serine/threonine protein kinase [Victivallaceae bacterium]|nr:serine/threonine protein kinase [Victivallaceae bacterium]